MWKKVNFFYFIYYYFHSVTFKTGSDPEMTKKVRFRIFRWDPEHWHSYKIKALVLPKAGTLD